MNRLALLCVVLFCTTDAWAGDAINTDKLGDRIAPLTAGTIDGTTLTVVGGDMPKATVVLLLSDECPVSNAYTADLARLGSDYGDKSVRVIALFPEATTNDGLCDKASELKGLSVGRDKAGAVANALKATTTPEAFVIDRHGVLRYRGRIDDAFYARLKKNARVGRRDLQEAIDDVLAGKAVRIPATTPIGCPINPVKAAINNADVTFYRDVLPVLQANCQSCHRPGEVGPFSLTTYEQARRWADDVAEYARTRQMPPWKPVAGVPFANERHMTDADIRTLVRWAEFGAPAGDPKDAPKPREFTNGWQLGEPDLVLTVPKDMRIGPGGSDLFRVFVLPTGLTEDKYVTAFEVRPGNRKVVHHTLNFVDTTGAARKLEDKERARVKGNDEQDRGPGYSTRMGIGIVPRGAIGGWAPGQVPRPLPDGVGYYLPKNSDFVLQVHYHRTGAVELDRTQIGLYFAQKPVKQVMYGVPVGVANPLSMLGFRIPAGNEAFEVKKSLWVDQDCTIYSVIPHMHLLGKSIKVTMTPPDGTTTTLVQITDWDYNWQETYYFKNPIAVKAGARFDVISVFDNSARNPRNPHDPPIDVRFGEQTTNEMSFGFIGATSNRPGPVRFALDEKRTVLLPPARNRPKAETVPAGP